ncbi:MAG: hypothetical protein ABI946_07785 [Chthoniobacterales bacterium]
MFGFDIFLELRRGLRGQIAWLRSDRMDEQNCRREKEKEFS